MPGNPLLFFLHKIAEIKRKLHPSSSTYGNVLKRCISGDNIYDMIIQINFVSFYVSEQGPCFAGWPWTFIMYYILFWSSIAIILLGKRELLFLCFLCSVCHCLFAPPLGVCLFVLKFYGPVNPIGSCRARSVYLTTRLLDRLSPLSG